MHVSDNSSLKLAGAGACGLDDLRCSRVVSTGRSVRVPCRQLSAIASDD